jgi:hypothetical protein
LEIDMNIKFTNEHENVSPSLLSLPSREGKLVGSPIKGWKVPSPLVGEVYPPLAAPKATRG